MSRIQFKITKYKTKQPIFKRKDNKWRLPHNNFKTGIPMFKKKYQRTKRWNRNYKKEPNENSEIEKKILKLKIQSLKMPLTPTELGVLGRSSDELQSGVNYSKSSGKLLKRISLF